jgi:hypothetical protein
MQRTKSGLPKYCCWNVDRKDGKRRVRFRKDGCEKAASFAVISGGAVKQRVITRLKERGL